MRFRVLSVEPNPNADLFPEPYKSEKVLLRIEMVDEGRVENYSMTPAWMAPYVDGVRDASASGAVYWADLTFPTATFLPGPYDDRLHRLLDAIKNGQVVAS